MSEWTANKPTGTINQTQDQFLTKYANALDANGRFIPGKANLNYDGMKGTDVYNNNIGTWAPIVDTNGVTMDPANQTWSPWQSEVNADWIEDPRAKGWIGQHPKGAAMLAAMATMGAASGAGLLGSGAGGGLAGSEAAMLGGTGAEAFGTNAAYNAAMQSAMAAGQVGAGASTLSSLGGTGASSLAPASPSWLSNMGYVDGAAPVMGGSTYGASAAVPSMGSVLGGSSAGYGTLGGATAVGGGMIGSGTAAEGAAAMNGSGLWGSIKSGVGLLNDFTGGNLGAIAGSLLGAASSKDTTTSQNRDPWGPAQQYLKDNLATNAAMQRHYQANPFSNEQKTAYQGSFDANANAQANVGGLLANANNFGTSNRGQFQRPMQAMQSGVTAPPIDWTKYANIGAK